MKLGVIISAALWLISLPGASQTINFSGKDLQLTDVFPIIKSQTGVLFFYDAKLMRETKPVTIEWKQVTLEAALNDLFKDQPLTWVLEDKTVTVIKRQPIIANSGKSVLPFPAPVRVKGIITDADGNPITGVSVMIKGTNQGTQSDHAGAFSIMVYPKNVLTFSSVNYTSKEVSVEKRQMNIKLELHIKPIESTLVGGNMNAVKRKSESSSVTVLDAKTLEKIPMNTLDQVYRGWVPGTNSFNVGDQMEGLPTLSIRGAAGPNSLAPIAVYIDGIEYAGGSGYLSQLDKNNIDRIEIVRGPGAATMYGTGSDGGIVQIFTKKGKADQDYLRLTSSAGFYKSKWVAANPFQQLHNLETNTGFKKVAIMLGGSYRAVAAYLPDGGEKSKGFYGSAKVDVEKLQANFHGRYIVRNFSASRKPYFDTAINPRNDITIESDPGVRTPAYLFLDVRPTPSRGKDGITETHITTVNLSHKTTDEWVNNFDAGYTMNTTRETPLQDGVVPLQRQYYAEKYSTAMIRYTNLLTLHHYPTGISTRISSGAEYKKYSSWKTYTRATTLTSSYTKEPENENYGVFMQANASYKHLYLTLGLRYEKNNLFKPTCNPRVGITTNFEIGTLRIKPRVSWGKGISSPSYNQRFGQPSNMFTVVYANPDIKPQLQEGIDYGVEFYDRKGLYKFEVVYYDNVLKDMIAEEAIKPDPAIPGVTASRYTNAGKVANRGWEFSGEYQLGRLSLMGSVSIMSSTIADTTGVYQIAELKDKTPGARMKHLPRHTAGLNLNYSFYKLFGKADKGIVSLSVTAVDGILTSDYRKYILDVAYGRTDYIAGSEGYPVEISPILRIGLYADYHVANDFRLFIQGYNILNDYQYEYSSEYPTHGATWLFGIKYNYASSK